MPLTTPLAQTAADLAHKNALIAEARNWIAPLMTRYGAVEAFFLSLPSDRLNALIEAEGLATIQTQLECSLALGNAVNAIAEESNIAPYVSTAPFAEKLAAHGKQLNADGTISDLPQPVIEHISDSTE